ncbi:MAG: glutathione S-transferase C-terminal domain-containing protein, partial [Gammaproteobacteria bacterium]
VLLLCNPAKPGPMRLETIGASHYVEKVRWCLDRLGIDYVEDQNLGVFGAMFGGRTVPRLHVRTGAVESSIGNSSDILRFLWGREGDSERAQFLAPTEEAVALEKQLDRYGALMQQWIYFHILDEPELCSRAWGANDPRVPAWQRAMAGLITPLLRVFIRRAFRIESGRNEKTLARVDQILSPLEEAMGDGRRYLLGGDELSYVDLTLAALSGLWLMPLNYGAGMADDVRFPSSDAPEAMQRDMQLWRDAYPKLVAHMEALYANERLSA